jgi:pSer/pThr/pTyr-binding forkhead associated (FHA) protein
MSICWSCGKEVSDQLSCSICGADLNSQTSAINISALRSTPTPAPRADPAVGSKYSESDDQAVSELPADRALLVVKRGPQAGSRFLLDSEIITVGRASGNEIFLDDVSVSRKHAVFQRAFDSEGRARFSVRDVGSLNGTYVNRTRIEVLELSSGDEVQIGKFRLVFYPGVTR